MKKKTRGPKKKSLPHRNSFSAFYQSYPGRIFLFLCLCVFVGSINILIAKNNLSLFFLYSGIAIILSIIVGWMIYLFSKNQ